MNCMNSPIVLTNDNIIGIFKHCMYNKRSIYELVQNNYYHHYTKPIEMTKMKKMTRKNQDDFLTDLHK